MSKSENIAADPAKSSRRRNITFSMNSDVIRRLKERAVYNRRTYSTEVEIAILEYLEREEKRQAEYEKLSP